MSLRTPIGKAELDQIIEEEFGVNASYVAGLWQQYDQNPQSVDDEWRSFFEELLGGNGNTTGSSSYQDRDAKPIAPVSAAHPAPASRQAGSATAPGTMTPSGDQLNQSRQAVSNPPAPAAPYPARGAGLAAAPASPVSAPATPGRDELAIRGPALRIAQNMEASLAVPTATSQRQVPIKLLDENRRLINTYLESPGGKVSYTHLVARAILKALLRFPALNDSYQERDRSAFRIRHPQINLGLAVDVVRRDGSRALLVPNVKNATELTFPELVMAYQSVVTRARDGKLQIEDFQGTTISLTNPGTLGTTASNPRLMAGQGLIVATGSIEYPPEYSAMSPEALSRLGISKIMTLTSTYDHRIIQGAESGSFLALIDQMLRGQHEFYDEIFAELGMPFKPYRWSIDHNPAILGEDRRAEEVRKQARVLELINAYRVRGHLVADIDPLGAKQVYYHPELDIETYGLTIWDLDRQFVTGGLGGTETASLRQIVEWLRSFYCGKFGIEYRNIQSPVEKQWISSRIEKKQPAVPPEAKHQILWKLISAESFEKFLGAKYLGQKRFSIEGAETVVALLDQLIEGAARRGVVDITIGMSHRGRLNVIANVIGKFCERIFTSFEGSIHPNYPHDQGDVKYHQGASGVRETAAGGHVSLTLPPNPSHLEFVDPVVEGMVRAKQDLARRNSGNGAAPGTDVSGTDSDAPKQATADGASGSEEVEGRLAVLIHGDAAFAGEGIVAETLNLSGLEGYGTGGTVHIIVNNQLGFTTPPEAGRSSVYSTDVAKMIQIPIFHVNGDDPEAGYNVLQIALDYRQQFNKDVVIDVIGFRRHGHNEGDEPTYTQPVMYKRVRSHPGVRALYAGRLVAEGAVDEKTVESLMEERTRRYENALLGAKEIVTRQDVHPEPRRESHDPQPDTGLQTGVASEELVRLSRTLTTVPQGFNLNPKITGLLARRAKMVEGSVPVDWGMAEALAFGSLLDEGTPVRLSGQDSIRGTFSHRHAAFFDTQTDQVWTPLETISSAKFEVWDSPLSEAGVLGFEYGYTVTAPKTLVIWEAQFGDFVNAAQVIIDQFIVPGEEKWDQKSRIVLLLPHGLEGQGPEHSSARIERFLQLAAEGNIQVVYPTTAAQYFHLFRRQMRQPSAKPLIVMTPKSLLRLPEAASSIEQFTNGRFEPLLAGTRPTAPSAVKRILLCSGKVYYDLEQERKKLGDDTIAIFRLEQLYPFPSRIINDQLASLESARDIRWVQEEPANMGGWSFVEARLRSILRVDQTLKYVGRLASPSPATGSHTIHQMEQRKLVAEAFSL
jgi:2-oxoglutarate decarboxylase